MIHNTYVLSNQYIGVGGLYCTKSRGCGVMALLSLHQHQSWHYHQHYPLHQIRNRDVVKEHIQQNRQLTKEHERTVKIHLWSWELEPGGSRSPTPAANMQRYLMMTLHYRPLHDLNAAQNSRYFTAFGMRSTKCSIKLLLFLSAFFELVIVESPEA